MANKRNNPKRDHHVLPELYLKGFVIKKGEPFIWIYKRGELYNPGQGKITNNPFKDSIRRASVERDYYADPKDGGKKDFETFENRLEALEKPANPIFEKLREHQTISEEEKLQFSIYIVQMHRRVQSGREMTKKLVPRLVANYEPAKVIFQKLNWPDIPETRAYLKETSKRMAQKEGFDIQMHLRAIPAAQESFLVETLQKMTWHFFTAPQGHAFLTGDNPVFIPEQHGLGKNVSELSFPISTHVALVASWHRELKAGFFEATPQVVKELNRRTAHKASRCLYFSQNPEWVVTLLNKSVCEYRPMHSAKSVFTVVKLVADGPESKPHLIFSM